MKSSIDDSRQSLGLFSKDWNVFKSNFTNARKTSIEHPIYEDQTIALNGGGFKSGISSIFRSKDLNGLKEYNRYVEAGLHPMKAYSLSMKGCSEEATKSIKSMGSSSKAAAIGMKALSIASNMIVGMVVIKVVELVATAINNYANRIKYAQEGLDEFNNTVSQSKKDLATQEEWIKEHGKNYSGLNFFANIKC